MFYTFLTITHFKSGLMPLLWSSNYENLGKGIVILNLLELLLPPIGASPYMCSQASSFLFCPDRKIRYGLHRSLVIQCTFVAKSMWPRRSCSTLHKPYFACIKKALFMVQIDNFKKELHISYCCMTC